MIQHTNSVIKCSMNELLQRHGDVPGVGWRSAGCGWAAHIVTEVLGD